MYSDAVTMSATGQVGHWSINVGVDPESLDSATYPVYIDPTITDFPTPSTSAQDTFASSKYPTSSFASYQRPDSPYYYELWHGIEPGTSYNNEVYIRFKELTPTLGSVHIDSASLEMYPYWQYYHSTPRPSWVQRVLDDWSGGTLTWNNRPAVDPNYIGIPSTTEGTWTGIDVTEFVQRAVTGEWDNHGFMLSADGTGQGNWKRFVSLEDTSSPDRTPHLSVTWSAFVPFNFSPADATPTASRVLTWSTDAITAPTTAYQVEVSTSSGFGTTVATSGTVTSTSSTWSIPSTTSLSNNATYYWHVRDKYGVNTTWSGWSPATSFVYKNHLPVATTDSPDADGTADVTLDWSFDDGDGLSGTVGTQASYRAQVATASDFHSGTVIADSSVTNTAASSWNIPGTVTLTNGST